jgi:hypothetical protein
MLKSRVVVGSVIGKDFLLPRQFHSFLKARQVPIGKRLKTFGFAHHGATISSRIREVREKLYWFLLQRGTLQLEVLDGLRACEIALVNAGLDEKDEAFAWLEKAYGVRDKGLTSLKIDACVDPLRSDPRFHHLVRRVGLPP